MFLSMCERLPIKNDEVAAALQRCATAYSEIRGLAERLGRDTSRTEGAKIVATAKAARAKVLPMVEALDNALKSAEERGNAIRAQMAEIYNPPGKPYETCMRHAEIRAMVRQMPRGEALKLLEAARQANDTDTLIALVAYQPFLSGIPPELHQHARDHLVQAKMPEHAATLKAMKEQADLSGIFRSELLQSLSDLVNFEQADSIMEAAREDVAAS
jgi:hypothetical protein